MAIATAMLWHAAGKAGRGDEEVSIDATALVFSVALDIWAWLCIAVVFGGGL